jgi:hypothetical protein
MKKPFLHIVLFAFLVFTFSSCQKNLATFQKTSSYNSELVKSEKIPSLTTTEFEKITETAITSVSSEEVIAPSSVVSELPNSVTTESSKLEKTKVAKKKVKFDFKKIEAETGKKVTFKQKIVLKVLEKKMNSTNAVGDSSDTLALISLISGILALVSIFLIPFAPIILSLVGLITGIMAIKRDTSKRGMAITGIILSSILLVITLLIVLLFASLVGAAKTTI